MRLQWQSNLILYIFIILYIMLYFPFRQYILNDKENMLFVVVFFFFLLLTNVEKALENVYYSGQTRAPPSRALYARGK